MAAQNDASPSPRAEAEEIQGVPFLTGDGSMGLGSLQGGPLTPYGEGVGREGHLNLYRKLRAILTSVERIQKDKLNTQGNYKYASESAIKEALHPLFMEHGLLLVPTYQELLNFTPPVGDKKSYITTLKCRFDILDVDTGATLPMEMIISGGDSLDKGATKAVTGAIKYCLTTLFLIPTGDDPEADPKGAARTAPQARQTAQRGPQDPESPITEAQVKRMFALASSVQRPMGEVKGIVGSYGYESSKEIKAKDYEAICTEIHGA